MFNLVCQTGLFNLVCLTCVTTLVHFSGWLIFAARENKYTQQNLLQTYNFKLIDYANIYSRR